MARVVIDSHGTVIEANRMNKQRKSVMLFGFMVLMLAAIACSCGGTGVDNSNVNANDAAGEGDEMPFGTPGGTVFGQDVQTCGLNDGLTTKLFAPIEPGQTVTGTI